MLASCNNSKRCPALRYYCPNVSQLVCNWRNMLLGVPKVIGWLVWMRLMSAFHNMVRNSGKTNTFLILLAFLLGSMSAVSQNSYISWLDLAILWHKVTKNYGVPEIRVFLGRILVFLWPKVPKNHGVPEIRVFLGLILAFLWPKVTKSHGVPKIRVFLHPEMLEFHGVGELSCWGCKLKI